MKKALKIILINVFIFLILIIMIDLTSIIIINYLKYNQKKKNDTVDIRATFPVYKNYNWSHYFYSELYNLNIEYRSYYGWRAIEFKGKAININKDGVRKTIEYWPKYKNANTISFFGGSTIWGFGVNDSSTIPSFFQKHAKGNYIAFNYGEQAFRSFQSLQLMQIEFSKKQITDIVVFYDGANNYISLNQRYFSTNRESQIIERLKGMDKDLNGINNQYSDKFDISNHYLYSTKFLINKFITKLSPTKNLTTPKLLFNSQNDSLAATELLETWLLAKKYVESKNKRFICILQPTFFTSKSPKNNYIINSIDSSPFTNSTYNYYNLVRNFINKNKYKELKNNFYDFSFELNKKDSIYIDFCHLGPTGNNIIAEKIYNTIKN